MTTRYLLDTNVVSESARPNPEPAVIAFFEGAGEACLSAITLFELSRGVEVLTPGRKRRFLEEWLEEVQASFEVLPIAKPTALLAARLEVKLGRAGRSIEVRDLFIAAAAAEHELTLVTRNVSHFRGLGVTIVNPWE